MHDGSEDLSDEAMEVAMAPIHRWSEARDREARWNEVAERLNAFLGDGWPAPPWSGDQASTVAMCLSLAEDTLPN
jgi:hypothetical protein